MKLTKYTHACLVLEKDGSALVIDPGQWSNDFVAPEHVVGVVVTHAHQDHYSMELLRSIIDANPDAHIYAHADVAAELENLPVQTVVAGENVHVGNFALSFFGGEHAAIEPSRPTQANLGVMVDDLLYYPGDSFALPDRSVNILALPVSAPWMKFSEATEFLRAIKPQRAFPTHDAILSETGMALADSMFQGAAASIGTEYQRIKASSSIEI
jgi:L-ascorbate metabolism protein UlaG (beta-lactamase superfamily)